MKRLGEIAFAHSFTLRRNPKDNFRFIIPYELNSVIEVGSTLFGSWLS